MGQNISFLFFTYLLVIPMLSFGQANSAAMQKLAVHPLVKLIGKKETDPVVKQAIAKAGLTKTVIGTYNRSGGNTFRSVMPMDGLFDNLSYSYSITPYKALAEVVKPSDLLPLALQWGIDETGFLEIAGIPLWVEQARKDVFSNSHYFVLPLTGNSAKVIVASFEFRNATRNSGDVYRLSDIRFSLKNKTEAVATGKIPGAQHAAPLMKSSDGKIAAEELANYIATQKESGYLLSKTFYPQFDRAYINETTRIEADAVPARKNVLVMLVKDTFDIGNTAFLEAKMLDNKGKIAWSQKTKFSKLIYDKELGFYQAGAAFSVPAMPAGSRYVITSSYYDKTFMNRPIYGLLFYK
jgi:hypothetical protein